MATGSPRGNRHRCGAIEVKAAVAVYEARQDASSKHPNDPRSTTVKPRSGLAVCRSALLCGIFGQFTDFCLRATTAVPVDISIASESSVAATRCVPLASRNYTEANGLKFRATEPDSPSDKQHASYSSERDACGHHFLCESKQRETNDPNQIHYACIEQEGH